ncbi:MAG: hypothetical protein JNM18_08595 [Planctomycetaceae bacterium]|nr:hypothetical protein [Planctomycetaceae bacterium]
MIDWSKAKPAGHWQLPFEGAWPTAVALLPSGKQLVAGNEKGELFVWDLPGDLVAEVGKNETPPLAPVRQLVGHENGITRIVALPGGHTIATASLDHTVRLWDLNAATAGTAEVVLDRESRERKAKKGDKQANSAPGVTVAQQTDCVVLKSHADWVSALALSRDGSQLVSGDYRAQVIVWDVASRAAKQQWQGLAWNWIVALAFTPDAKSALVSEVRYKRDDFDVPAAALRVWNVTDAQVTLDLLKAQFPKYDPQAASYEASQVWRKFVAAGLVAVDVSPDGKLLAAGQGGETDKGTIHLLDATSGKLVRSVGNHQYGVTDLRFTSDGRYLLSVGRDTTLRVTTVADGKELLALNAPRGGQFKDWLSALSVSADERRVAAADIAGLVHVWQLVDD